MDINIKKKNENYITVDCSGVIAHEIYDHFSFMVPDAKFMPQYRSGMWDGYVHLFNGSERTLPCGLLIDLLKFAKMNSYVVNFDSSEFRRVFTDEEINSFRDRLPELTKNNLTGVYSYQWDTVEMCLRTSRLLIQSPTGCMDENTEIEVDLSDEAKEDLERLRS